jgi:anti-sigma28 factor (negative regulator of flagellin synthesis)
LTQAVQSGTYSVSNQQIAQSLVRDFRSTNSAAQL